MAGKRLALIIGNSVYRDANLARLKAPESDVGALAEVLQDVGIGAFDDVQVLINTSSTAVRRAISNFFAKKSREDLLLLYFSGHGVLDEHGRLYLAVKDTETGLLRGTAIPATHITDEMDNSGSQRQILILDCCHSGAFARGTKGALGTSVGTANIFGGTGFGRVILTATDATQFAWEGDQIIGEAENSLFTHFLIEGIQTGAADINGDGKITIDELYDYVYDQVVKSTPRQTPGKWSFKEQGEIIIANNPRTEERAPAVVPGMPSTPRIVVDDDEERKFLENLYTKALSAFWLEDWEKSIKYFSELVERSPAYLDAPAKLEEASRQQRLVGMYRQSQAAITANNFSLAIATLETLVAEALDYKDAATLLASARKSQQLADLYNQAIQLSKASQWQAVIAVFERIHALQPDFPDPDNLLANAMQEQENLQRRADMQEKYRSALLALNQGDWKGARKLLQQVLQFDPGYEKAAPLLARVESEINRKKDDRRIQEQIAMLYEQAKGFARARRWRQALQKIQEIEKLDGQFPDPENINARVREAVAQEEAEAQRQSETDGLYAEAVRLVRAQRYREALAKWAEVRARDPAYPDPQHIQTTARGMQNNRGGPNAAKGRFGKKALVWILPGILVILIVTGLVTWQLLRVTSQVTPTSFAVAGAQETKRAVPPPTQAPAATTSVPTYTPRPTITKTPFPTYTLLPTNTPWPTMTLTPTMDADPSVYDNFNRQIIVGDSNQSRMFNPNLWTVWNYSDPNSVFIQQFIQPQNGILEVHISEQNEEADLGAIKYGDIPIKEPLFFEVSVKITQGSTLGQITMRIGEIFRFFMHFSGDTVRCGTSVSRTEANYHQLGSITVTPGQWHKLRVEVNPETMTFTSYVDSIKIYSGIPPEAENYKTSNFDFTIGANTWKNSGETFITQFDDVRIGPIGK